MPPPRYLVALITPFDARGEVDLEAHRRNLQTLDRVGITGFVLGGSNGEGPYLEPGERARLVDATRETLDGAYVMCGVMAETVRVAAAQVKEAAEADGLLVLTPTTLTRNRPAYVRTYFQEVAELAPRPCFLYSVPNTTAYNLEESLVAELAQHPNIGGMKDSSGDPVRLQRLVASTPDQFLIWSGSSQAMTLGVTAGVYGAITGSGNYAPRLALETLEAARRDPFEATELQRRLSSVSQQVESKGIPAVKAASVAAGLDPGLPRLPLTPPEPEEAERLQGLVREMG